MLQHQLDLASPAVHLSIVDNLLVAHYPALAQSAVFDPSVGGRQQLVPLQPLVCCKPAPQQVILA